MTLDASTWIFTTVSVARLACWSFLCFWWCYHRNALILAVCLLIILKLWVWALASWFILLMLNIGWTTSIPRITAPTLCISSALFLKRCYLRTSSSSRFVPYLLCSTSWISRRTYTLKYSMLILINYLSLCSFILWNHTSISYWIVVTINYHFSYARYFWFLKFILTSKSMRLCLTKHITILWLSSKTTKSLNSLNILTSSILPLSLFLWWSFVNNSFVWLQRTYAHWNNQWRWWTHYCGTWYLWSFQTIT
jgi:hypothetical protein